MFGKIFDSFFDSSIIEETVETRYLWQCMIVLADKDGNIDMMRPALARRVNLPLDVVNFALTRLTSPDPLSRSPEQNGRRLIPLENGRDWGWHLVNRQKYAEMKSPEERRAYMREYMRKKRAEEVSVNPVSSELSELTYVEVDADEEVETKDSCAAWIPIARKLPERLTKGPVRKTAHGVEFGVLESVVKEFEDDFPGLDVRGELRKARSWSINNPGKRKTYPGQGGGVLRFLNTWLSKAQNSGRSVKPDYGSNGNGTHAAAAPEQPRQPSVYKRLDDLLVRVRTEFKLAIPSDQFRILADRAMRCLESGDAAAAGQLETEVAAIIAAHEEGSLF